MEMGDDTTQSRETSGTPRALTVHISVTMTVAALFTSRQATLATRERRGGLSRVKGLQCPRRLKPRGPWRTQSRGTAVDVTRGEKKRRTRASAKGHKVRAQSALLPRACAYLAMSRSQGKAAAASSSNGQAARTCAGQWRALAREERLQSLRLEKKRHWRLHLDRRCPQ